MMGGVVWLKTLPLGTKLATNFANKGPPQAENFEVLGLQNDISYSRNRVLRVPKPKNIPPAAGLSIGMTIEGL